MGGYHSNNYDEGDCPRSAIGRHMWNRTGGGIVVCGFCDQYWIVERYTNKKTQSEIAWNEGLEKQKRIEENERLRQHLTDVSETPCVCDPSYECDSCRADFFLKQGITLP